MISGVPVDVLRPIAGARDRLGTPTVTGYTRETVNNVLIEQGVTDSLEASRPDGVTVAYTLHFPKTYSEKLEGCNVELPAPWAGVYRIVGDPRPLMDANTPTEWHMPAMVEAAHG